MPVPGDVERKPYKLVRGSFSRRDGNMVTLRDNETGQKIKGVQTREYVRYTARTADKPNARDEIMLSDKEAKALGKRVIPLVQGNVETREAFDRDHVQEQYTLDQLIATGQAVSGTKSLASFRDMVFKSGLILDKPVPNKKHDILNMLRQIKADLAREAAEMGLGPLGSNGLKANNADDSSA